MGMWQRRSQWLQLTLATLAVVGTLGSAPVLPSDTTNRECENTDCSVKRTPPTRCGIHVVPDASPDKQCGW